MTKRSIRTEFARWFDVIVIALCGAWQILAAFVPNLPQLTLLGMRLSAPIQIRWRPEGFDELALCVGIALLGLAATLAVLTRRRRPTTAWTFGLFAILLAPTLALVLGGAVASHWAPEIRWRAAFERLSPSERIAITPCLDAQKAAARSPKESREAIARCEAAYQAVDGKSPAARTAARYAAENYQRLDRWQAHGVY